MLKVVCVLKITVNQNENEEESIVINIHQINQMVMDFIKEMQSQNKIIGYIDNEIHMIDLKDIFYIETVEGKIFIFCEKKVFTAKEKIHDLEDLLTSNFIRISKTMILNIRKIKYFKYAFQSRLEAHLNNGEKVIISRQYATKLKEILHLGRVKS